MRKPSRRTERVVINSTMRRILNRAREVGYAIRSEVMKTKAGRRLVEAGYLVEGPRDALFVDAPSQTLIPSVGGRADD
jgi:hypothetical protein